MAKKKGNRVLIGLKCSICGRNNYVSQKNRINTTDKLSLKKLCKGCKKVVEHKEVQRLK